MLVRQFSQCVLNTLRPATPIPRIPIGQILRYSTDAPSSTPAADSTKQNLPAPPPGWDTKYFLGYLGHNLERHHSKFTSWDTLISADRASLLALEIPPKDARYIQVSLDRYRAGWPLHRVPIYLGRAPLERVWQKKQKKKKV
eukprot:TRINITY_DN12085_c0_g1::TRINITY_DN12085_c0_g1_i1::g.9698::m.9698 TRINITY_DN12085_c0_g1::TRINITY_DN12085_c0_g1_i1::g.9698  ORF type:complete len:142 (+),score=2.39,IGR/PF09597.5/8.3e-08 TRINITY_DN12085_c0_g1_i1:97-522(+)